MKLSEGSTFRGGRGGSRGGGRGGPAGRGGFGGRGGSDGAPRGGGRGRGFGERGGRGFGGRGSGDRGGRGFGGRGFGSERGGRGVGIRGSGDRGGRGFGGRGSGIERGGRGGGRGGSRGGGMDRRFDAARSDPRFRQIAAVAPEHHDRGTHADLARRAARATVDRRGVPVAGAAASRAETEALQRRHRVQQDAAPTDDEEDVEGEEGPEHGFDMGRGEMEEVEEGEEVDEDDDDEDEAAAFGTGADVEECDATRRVAVVNCDWDHIRAVDIFALFNSCLPVGGVLRSVALYLSDFGHERLQYERKNGPNLWVKKGEAGFDQAKDELQVARAANAGAAGRSRTAEMFAELEGGDDAARAPVEGEDSDDDAGVLGGGHGSDDDDDRADHVEDEEEELFSSGKHRQYELDRMRYYYAVATFDSATTAQAVYKTCDGVDVEASGVVLDLRYIPDEETFDAERVQGDVVKRLPPHHTYLKAFKAAALSQSKFKISWDRDDAQRAQCLRDAFTDDTEEGNLAVYMASSSDTDSSSDAGAQKDEDTAERDKRRALRRREKRMEIRRRYAALLADIGGLDESSLPKDPRDRDSKAAAASSASGSGSGSDDDGFGALSAARRGVDKAVASDDDAESDMEGEYDEEGADDDLADLAMGEMEEVEEDDEEGDDDGEEGEEAERDSNAPPSDWDEGEWESDEDDARFKPMEAKMSLDADDRAQALQRALVKKKELQGATLGELAEAKYRQKRKEQRELKREAIQNAKAMARDPTKDELAAEAAKLRSALGDAVMAPKATTTGRQRVKEHARARREEAQQQKTEQKQRRALRDAGLTPADVAAVLEKQKSASAPAAAAPVLLKQQGAGEGAAPIEVAGLGDTRFTERLVGDARYHIDVTTDTQRADRKAVAQLAAQVAERRHRGGVPAAGTASAKGAPAAAKAPASAEVDDALAFFGSGASRRRARD